MSSSTKYPQIGSYETVIDGQTVTVKVYKAKEDEDDETTQTQSSWSQSKENKNKYVGPRLADWTDG